MEGSHTLDSLETQPKMCPLSHKGRQLPKPPKLLREAQDKMLKWESAFHLKHNPEEREKTLASSWLDP